MRRRSPIRGIVIVCLTVLAAGAAAFILIRGMNPLTGADSPAADQSPQAPVTPAPLKTARKPSELMRSYFSDLNDKKYGDIYNLLTAQSRGLISLSDFTAKYKNIYEGIDARNIGFLDDLATAENESQATVSFTMRMDTLAGEIVRQNSAIFDKDPETGEYLMEWTPGLIFPNLNWNDTVKVKTLIAKRGPIFDRNGVLLAGEGEASSVGLVPGKMRGGSLRTEPTGASPDEPVVTDPLAEGASVPSPAAESPTAETPAPAETAAAVETDTGVSPDSEAEADIARIAELLDVSADSIHKKLSASWVRDDVFVPLRNISKDNQALEKALLEIPGVKITTVTVRYYPLAEKASHLIGYIQNVTADDLVTLKDKGYDANSVVGKAGLEGIYEDQLRARDGYEIDIVNSAGDITETLAKQDKIDGKAITLTIDADIQSKLYDQFASDKSCSAAINPVTGAVLALVSTPSYNANDFVLGMSENKWNALNGDENRPLYNRFRAALCPGSTMKPITAAIGLNTGTILPDDDFGPSGLRWQNNGNWGGYYVTTMTEYAGPANIENALVYSDNIFAAKAALKIGAGTFASELKRIGFEEQIPFEYGLYSSVISGTESFTSEIQLADSGYGQGQILINPVHMSVIYASFLNNGNILKPQLLKTGFAPAIWIKDAFTPETASIIKDDLVQVIERGTGKTARIPGQVLAGKTGTAEIKLAKGDINGTELGWFVMFTADENAPNPLLVTAMVEDVKDRGGSHYLTDKVKTLFEQEEYIDEQSGN